MRKLPLVGSQQYERYIPNAFDETLSIVEKVNKVIHSQNDVINNTNEVVDEVVTLKEEIPNLINEDVTEWFGTAKEDGTLNTIINEQVFTELSGKIDGLEASSKQVQINVKDFGAKGDGVTDDTDAIRLAIANTPKGGKLVFPATSVGYLCQPKTEPYLFLWDKPMIIQGSGRKSKIIVSQNVSTTIDVFKITPSTTATDDDYRGFDFVDMNIETQGSLRAGRHALHFDLSLEGKRIANSVVRNSYFSATGGYSIKVTNPLNTDGFFTNLIEGNTMFGGIHMERCGDSVSINTNVIAGHNGVDISMVDGSNTLVLFENNITARHGVILRSGHNIKVLYNNIEVGYSDSVYPNGALLDVDGEEVPYAWGLLATEIIGNNFTYRPNTPDNVDAIRINKARGTVISGNHIAYKNSNHIRLTEKAQETTINYNLFSGTDAGGTIVDNGINTQRNNVHQVSPTGQRQVYQHIANDLRNRVLNNYMIADTNNYSARTTGGLPNFNVIWDEGNTTTQKSTITTQKRTTSNTLESKKQVATLGDGKMFFPANNLVLQDTGGSYWSLSLTTAGVLVPTKLT